jgi:hypothetical protein
MGQLFCQARDGSSEEICGVSYLCYLSFPNSEPYQKKFSSVNALKTHIKKFHKTLQVQKSEAKGGPTKQRVNEAISKLIFNVVPGMS